MTPIPVTVLTGFLGAGKTTLLNQLLKHPEMAGSAVLINEFGEIGLDHLLVEKLDEGTVLLNAGCLCCTIRGDLQRALRDLALKADAGHDIRRVLIETTGLADPAPILQTLMSDPVALRPFRLDGVVTLVDAVLGAATLDSHIKAVKQAAVANRLILSKTDIASADQISTLEARLTALNPGAPIRRVVAGDVPPDFLFGPGGFDPAGKIADVTAWLAAGAAHHHYHHGHHHDPNCHDARIQAFGLTFTDPLPWGGLANWLEMLAITRGASILRTKAILNLQGEGRPVVLHGVQHVLHPPERLAAWSAGHDRRSRIVFILRDLDRAVVEEGLAAFLQAAREKTALAAGTV
ncbi:MAG: GTP-binding protein [Alphaproteobacteria bacterium]|nr:GTP-binding protein [Alphaproteobacteria bacterium]